MHRKKFVGGKRLETEMLNISDHPVSLESNFIIADVAEETIDTCA